MAAMHDETVYKDPDAFWPERFLPPENAQDSSRFAFGFGRRVCPGEGVAQATLLCMVVRVLAVFNIAKARDEYGKDVEPALLWSSGLTSPPHQFKCKIVTRSPEAMKLVEEARDG
ncbi:uncharacterized protein PHACADRAFT_260616 [Phanerochaete carnosa HHB-10118-sp]|uniref:Cytochrome P450 n=1 Tax=Phanerochaete carnosa (strain HHB-10118-sp) TaxID=650164 RepID=K5UR41_PHACS|nr:uncharacterized protein PHACADRAFT_260616 [Phanerochaete carnosa HHB-10118-sp]EKM52306.1 hypothetical protein PHACADRAFT_260616 [Phanerochaete carnosa HHB-10118-sp]